jgi:hypothetical protein
MQIAPAADAARWQALTGGPRFDEGAVRRLAARSGQIPVLILVLLPVLLPHRRRSRSVSLRTPRQSLNTSGNTCTCMGTERDGVRCSVTGEKCQKAPRSGAIPPARGTPRYPSSSGRADPGEAQRPLCHRDHGAASLVRTRANGPGARQPTEGNAPVPRGHVDDPAEHEPVFPVLMLRYRCSRCGKAVHRFVGSWE